MPTQCLATVQIRSVRGFSEKSNSDIVKWRRFKTSQMYSFSSHCPYCDDTENSDYHADISSSANLQVGSGGALRFAHLPNLQIPPSSRISWTCKSPNLENFLDLQATVGLWGFHTEPRLRARLVQIPIELEECVKQNVYAVGDVFRPRELPRRVADAAHARNEDHSHRCEKRHVLSIMARPAGH